MRKLGIFVLCLAVVARVFNGLALAKTLTIGTMSPLTGP